VAIRTLQRGHSRGSRDEGAEGGVREFLAFSGTSGGAIYILLAWYGLLPSDSEGTVKLLEACWMRATPPTSCRSGS
jgi:hypothetical protein